MGRHRSSCTDLTRIVRRRRPARGVASVEGLFVISFLSIFLFAMPFTYRLFAAWYEVQSGTRNRTLTNASKGCVGGGGGGSIPVGNGGESARPVASQKGDPGAVNATSSSLNMASGTASKSVGMGPFSATVTGNSFGSCNEVPQNTSVQSWSTFGFQQHQGQGTGDQSSSSGGTGP